MTMSTFQFSLDGNSIGLVGIAGREMKLASGFVFLRPDWVVTAKHVVVDRFTGEARPAVFRSTLTEVTYTARAAIIHPSLDLAVIELTTASACTRPLYPSYV